MKLLRVILWFTRLIEVAVVLLAAAAMGFYFWLHSQAGMERLARFVEQATGDQVAATGLSGRLPFYLSAQSVVVRDHDQVDWLAAKDVSVALSLRPLFRQELALSSVSVGQLEWRAMPHYPSQSPPESMEDIEPPSRPLKVIRIHQAQLDQVVVAEGIMGHAVEGSMSGKASWIMGGRLHTVVEVETRVHHLPDAKWNVEFARENGVLYFPSVQAARDQDTLAVSARYTPSHQMLRATASVRVANAADYIFLHGLELTGAARVDVTANHEDRSHPWIFDVVASSPHIQFGEMEARDLAVSGRVETGPAHLVYDAVARSDTFAIHDWVFRQPELRGSTTGRQHDLSVQTSGRHGDRTDFSAEATGYFTAGHPVDGWTATLSSFQGQWEEVRLTAGEPATWIQSNQTASLHVPAIWVDDTLVQADIQMQDHNLDAVEARIQPVDLARLGAWLGEDAPALAGEAELSVSISGLRESPGGEVRLTAHDILIDHGFLHHFEKAAIEMEFVFEPGGVVAHGTVEHPLLNRFELFASVPIEATGQFIPWRIAWSQGLDARIALAGSLREISETILTSPTAWSGEVAVDLAIRNLPHQPDFEGSFTWQNGQYRNLDTGTFLDQINVHLRGAQNTLRIEQARARDGGRGTVTAEGQLTFSAAWEPSWTLEAELHRATLFRLIQTELPLTGKITSIGTPESAKVEGQLWLEPFRFAIPRRLPPSIRVLDVVEINHPDPARNTVEAGPLPPPATAADPGRAIDLNIGVKTRRSFEVTGRGLQSEWRGAMQLTGTSRNPQLAGDARIVRGHAMLLGRRFIIDEGRIELTGPLPPNPQLNLSASTRIAEVIARLEVRGSANRPEIRLVSDPLLPEDEIMAMILFGKSVETMTPWQAIALANGLRILGGGGGDVVNLIDSSQSLLRVDQIDIKQDAEGEGFSSVAIGKHFGRRLYVEGEKGFGDAEDSVTVTLELSPRLVLETETSPRIREGVSLYWRKEL